MTISDALRICTYILLHAYDRKISLIHACGENPWLNLFIIVVVVVVVVIAIAQKTLSVLMLPYGVHSTTTTYAKTHMPFILLNKYPLESSVYECMY